MPDQLKLGFTLWTRDAVRELIRQRCGFLMPVRTVGEYLKRWGYTPQRPLHRAYQQKPEVVQHWLDNEYPRIAQRTRAENGEIQRSDEHTSELQSLMRISYDVFCLQKTKH